MASVIRSFIVCYIIYREDDYLLDGCQQIAIITGSVQQCDCPGEDRVGECGSSILNYLLAYINIAKDVPTFLIWEKAIFWKNKPKQVDLFKKTEDSENDMSIK